MSDSDDDYMSETILSGIQDVRPGEILIFRN